MQTTPKIVNQNLQTRERANIAAHRPQIAAICGRYSVAKLALFGSLTRDGEFGAGSDLDFLVRFLPGVRHGLSHFAMEEELEQLLGRKVELLTSGWLSKHFRAEIEAEALPIYGAN